MAHKPELPKGYLGPQAKFGQFGLQTINHNNPEINLDVNEVEIELKMATPVKVTGNLIQMESLKELPEYVFTQTKEDVVKFLVWIPKAGYYKLQIYALPLSDDSKTLPGVYNYLINCTNTPKMVQPFPKQFAQWKEGCYLTEPLNIPKGSPINEIRFKVTIPNCKAAAIVAEGEWTHLEEKGSGNWEGVVCLEQFRGKDAKVTLNANYGGEESKYSTLLEYKI
ncbi:hypothetical protein ScPMuIL_005273 [Solemya velum]